MWRQVLETSCRENRKKWVQERWEKGPVREDRGHQLGRSELPVVVKLYR